MVPKEWEERRTARGAMERGLEPALLMGHSMGELAALCVAGVFPPEEGVELVCARVQSLRAQGPGLGGMLALLGPVDATRKLLSGRPDVWEAVLNHDEQLVVSGRFEALTELDNQAAQKLYEAAGGQSAPVVMYSFDIDPR